MIRPPQVVVALLTPFAESGALDLGALREHVEYLVDAGVDGLMPCGTTGEGPLLEPSEVTAVVDATVVAARGRVKVLAHVGRPGTAETARLIRTTLAAGADGVSAIVPYFYAYSQDQLISHYGALIETADGVPLYAYNIPLRTGNDLVAATVRELATLGLTGIKDSTKSFERHEEYLGCGVEVFVGTDAFVLRALQAGATGCVSAIANARPDLLCALRDGAKNSNQGGGTRLHSDSSSTSEAQEEILNLRGELPMQRLKHAVATIVPGYPVRYRAPYA